ncbi:hypothetical protein AYO22_11399 [Fonsecaea multimorphosa]|nr:hypothetical protein AYO22_11399 [Fonsecaea multimorphosa]
MEGFTKGGVRRAVQQLPQSVDDAYTKILEGSRNPEKARKLLHMIIGATRPLTVGEMAMMMALDGSHKSYDDIEQELEPDERFEITLRDICGLFVVVIDKKVYLLHQTAKEFLHSMQLEESNRLLAERCIWYLCSNFIEASGGVLLEYACYNWPSHFREAGICSGEKITVLARKLCKEGSKEYTAWFAKYGSRYWFPKSSSSLPMASYFGLAGLVELLLDKGAALESRDSRFDRTPLFWAVRNRHEAVVKLLLDRGAEIDTKDKTGQTPLLWAAENGHEALVDLLLEKGGGIESRDENGRTPLSRAAQDGREAGIMLLLAKGAAIETRDRTGRTPLLWAAWQGREAVVKLLLSRGAHTEPKDESGRTALSLAAEYGREAIAKMLLEKGAEVDSRDVEGWTPLVWARHRGRTSLAKLLLENGANPGVIAKFEPLEYIR